MNRYDRDLPATRDISSDVNQSEKNMQTVRETIKAFFTLVHRWFHVDRIRISPVEGRLLSLQRGQYILLRQQIYVVFGPAAENSASKYEVTIHLDGDEGPAQLNIQRTVDGSALSARLLNRQGRLQDVFDDDVQVLNESYSFAANQV